jgi:hypothetical protein
MPDITVFINCDTRLAINLTEFNLEENDEFIFVIKNYSYIDSSYVFLYKARAKDIDANGEIFIRIPPATSRLVKPGAFYNFTVMKNAFDTSEPTEYKKLTDNGRVKIEYGAHDFQVKGADNLELESEVIGVRLEPVDEAASLNANVFMGKITDIRLELIEE